jgi:two-component system cell cycle response regulator
VSGSARTGRAPGAKALRLLLAVVLFGGTALVTLQDWLGLGGAWLERLAAGHLYDAVVVAAGIALLLRARAVPRERWAWLLLGAGVLCWATGEIYWTEAILDNPSPPYPSPADAFYLAFYPLAYAGLALLVRARARELDWRRWNDGVIAALGTAALGVAFVFDFVAGRTTGTSLEVSTSLAYPLGDIGMLALIVGVVALTDWRPGTTWSLLLAGLAFQVIADIAYTLQATGGVVPSGNWIDPFYLLSAAFIGAVLWAPSAAPIRVSTRSDRWRELAIPGLFAAVMIGLFAMQMFGTASNLSVIFWMATMVAVIVRLAMGARENQHLLEQVRTDALTGIGNRGGMQVDLDALFAHGHDVKGPAALYMFDLNGFKRYNDTFGHPAGDELLARFGERLRHAVGADGAAYRIGGDEFCVLLTCAPERFDAVAKRAAEALTECDRGVEVTASWGGAAIPTEADDPSTAMRLADVRMYAQKESRRVARGQPTADAPGSSVSAWRQPTSGAR